MRRWTAFRKMVLGAPEDYIESSVYFSWEQFFAEYLEYKTVFDNVRHYKKSHLQPYYTDGQVREKIKGVFPSEIRKVMETIVKHPDSAESRQSRMEET